MKKILLLAAIFAFGLQACYNDNEEELYPQPAGGSSCDTANATYSGPISKIISQNCALSGCHAGPSGSVNGAFDGYQNIKAYLNSNKPNFIGAINQTGGYSPMPKGGTKLSACDIQKIEVWINAGYPNN
jgi:hypothetical protein